MQKYNDSLILIQFQQRKSLDLTTCEVGENEHNGLIVQKFPSILTLYKSIFCTPGCLDSLSISAVLLCTGMCVKDEWWAGGGGGGGYEGMPAVGGEEKRADDDPWRDDRPVVQVCFVDRLTRRINDSENQSAKNENNQIVNPNLLREGKRRGEEGEMSKWDQTRDGDDGDAEGNGEL